MDISASHAPCTFALENTCCTDVGQSRGGGCVGYTKDLFAGCVPPCRLVYRAYSVPLWRLVKTLALEVSWENRRLCATRAEWWYNPARADRPEVWAAVTCGGRVTQFLWYARPVLGCWCHIATVTRTHVRLRRDGMHQYSTVVWGVMECDDAAQRERETEASLC